MKKTIVISNMLWRFFERTGAHIVSTVVSIILARLLSPSDYGTIALVTVFLNIMQVFIDSGLGTALIQKKNPDDLDYSSVFFFNLLVCIVLYILMFLSSPLIASLYNQQSLIPVIRVISLTLLISGIKNIQQAYVSKNMLFKKFFYATIIGTIISALLGISFAYLGFGVWALVIQQLSNSFIDTIVLWITVKWRPKFVFSIKRLKSLYSFGWKLLFSSLLSAFYSNIRSLVIGKKYAAEDLAYYNQGDKFPRLIVSNINASIDSVLLPTLVSINDDDRILQSAMKKAITVSTYIMAPIMLGMVACADSLILLMLTEKWIECVPYLRVFCISYLFWPIHTANLNAINSIGRSDIFLKLEIIKKIIGCVILILTMQIGPFAIACGVLASDMIDLIVNSWPNRNLIHYGLVNQIKDILPSILLAVGMGTVVYLIGFISLPTLPLLFIQVICGGMIYIMGSALLKLEPYEYLIGIIKPMIQNRRKV